MHPRPADQVSFRLAHDGEWNQVAAFLATWHPHNPKADPAILAWQYGSTTFGPTLTTLAEIDGEIVGHYTLFGLPSSVRGERRVTAHGADLVIHPQFRGRGLATQLLRSSYETGRRAGYELVVSNPNNSSLSAFQRAGLQPLPSPSAYFLTLHPHALLNRLPNSVPRRWRESAQPVLNTARKVAHQRGSTRIYTGVNSFVTTTMPGDAHGLIMQRHSSGSTHHTGVALSEEQWWQWRYERHPRSPYRFVELRNLAGELHGLAVIGPHPDDSENAWLVYQWAAINQQVFIGLMRSAARHAEHQGAHMLVAAVSSTRANAETRRGLRRAGFLALPKFVSKRALNLGVTDLSKQLLDIRARDWAFNFGDQDHL